MSDPQFLPELYVKCSPGKSLGIAFAIQGEEAVGFYESVSANEEIYQQPSGLPSAGTSSAARTSRKAKSTVTPNRLSDIEINRYTGLLQEWFYECL